MVHLIVDSMSDITQYLGLEMDVTVVPLSVEIDEEAYIDGVTIDTEEFYAKMHMCTKLPKTSQVAPEAFRKAFKHALANDGDEVLCITGGSTLSGTYQSATIARDAQPEDKRERVHLVDSMSATLGLALLVRAAVKLRDAGESAKAIQLKIEELKLRTHISATVGDLKYLVMGGRLPAVGAKIGGVLNLKPLLRVQDGQIKACGVCRGKAKVMEWLLDELQENPMDEAYPVMLGHADARESMEELKSFLMQNDACDREPLTMAIGCVIGSHTGPGTYGVAWVSKK